MYHITLTQRAVDGADVAQITLDGRTYRAASKNGVTMKVARCLVSAGYPDGPWRAVFPDGRPRFGGPSLRRLARYTIQETDRNGLQLRQYRPFGGWSSYKAAPSAEARPEVETEAEPATAW